MTAITVANLKGGVGKTTSSVLLGLGLAADDATVLISADPQHSALKWAQVAGDAWPWDRLAVVKGTDPRSLRRQIESAQGDYAHVVVDTPPSRERVRQATLEARSVEAALEATGSLVIPTSSSGVDLAEIPDTYGLATTVDQRRPVYVSVLLVRIWRSTRSATEAPAVLSEDFGYPVLRTVIPAREAIAQSFGTAPTLTGPFGAYADALTEIRARHDHPQES